MMKSAPIVLFVYNRPRHTRQTIEALKNNVSAAQSDLIIYSEGAKGDHDLPLVLQVRECLCNISGFRSVQVVERTRNWGCANNIIDGVSAVLNSYGSAVVVEDDISTSPYFLGYMNAALDFYQDRGEIFSISGYNHPPSLMKIPEDYKKDVFYCPRNACWGWAIWLDRWRNIDWEVRDFGLFIKDHKAQKAFNQGGEDLTDMLAAQVKGEIDSWSIRLTYHHYKHGGLAVWPKYSYTNNIGNDGSGTHCSATSKYENDLSRAIQNPEFPAEIKQDKRILKNYKKVYRRGPLTRLKKLLRIP
jgi:hypothetical protein